MSMVEKNDNGKQKAYLILLVGGIVLLILIAILVNQIRPGAFDDSQIQRLEIEVPDNAGTGKPEMDSILPAYLLPHDSVVLHYETALKFTTTQRVDSFLRRNDFKVLLIKLAPDADTKSLVTMMDKVTRYHVHRYVMVDFEQRELDSLLKFRR